MSKKPPKKPTTQSKMLRFLTPKGAANEERPSKMLIVEYSDSDSEQENNHSDFLRFAIRHVRQVMLICVLSLNKFEMSLIFITKILQIFFLIT